MTALSPRKATSESLKKIQGITLTAIVAKVYSSLLLNCVRPEVEKFFRKNQDCFSGKSIHNFTDSDCPSKHRLNTSKKSRANTFIFRFRKGIWFHTHRKYRTNTSIIWSLQKKPLQICSTKTQKQWFDHLMVTLISLLLESCREIHKHHFYL